MLATIVFFYLFIFDQLMKYYVKDEKSVAGKKWSKSYQKSCRSFSFLINTLSASFTCLFWSLEQQLFVNVNIVLNDQLPNTLDFLLFHSSGIYIYSFIKRSLILGLCTSICSYARTNIYSLLCICLYFQYYTATKTPNMVSRETNSELKF